MISMLKITNILSVFFAFNESKDSGSIYYEHNTYNDKFFRWTKVTFEHDKALCCVFNDVSIKLFNREKVYDRIKANKDKIKWNPDMTLFGCSMDVVDDLVNVINIESLTDKDIESLLAFKEEKKKDEKETRINKNTVLTD